LGGEVAQAQEESIEGIYLGGTLGLLLEKVPERVRYEKQ
jgi:hypothetical protein